MSGKQPNGLKRERHRWKMSLLESHPDIAVEAHGWNPLDFTAGSKKVKEWCCKECGRIWEATVSARAINNGLGARYCPDCSKTGFDQKSIGYIYFLQAERNGEIIIQYGITNHLKKRLSYHKRNGFTSESNSAFLECQSGQDALKIENLIKNRLISNGIPSISSNPKIQDKFPGYTESFLKSHLRVDSLKSLLDTLEIDVPLSKGIWIKYS